MFCAHLRRSEVSLNLVTVFLAVFLAEVRLVFDPFGGKLQGAQHILFLARHMFRAILACRTRVCLK
jgi:hypothetical protein